MSLKRTELLFFFAGLLPVVLIASFINQYGVNVPYGDDWALLPLFEKWSSEGPTFAPLWAQHSEHRIVIPKLIYLAFAYCTHWNLRAEMLFSLLLCVAT